MIPLAAQGGVDGRGDIHVIRMKDGDHEIGYAIAEALDIADVPLAMAIAREPGPVAGVIALDDDQIEMLDVHWLFADQIDGTFAAKAPLCLIVGSEDRTSVVSGKSVSVRVDLGGRRSIKKKNNHLNTTTTPKTPNKP